MKNTLAALLLFTVPALADVEIDRNVAASLKTYDCGQLESKSHELTGKIIRLKFFSRDSEIRTEDGENRSSVQSYYGYSNRSLRPKEGGSVSVSIPAEGLAWFSKVSTDWSSRSTYVVVAQVEKGTSVKILGREIKTDIRGSRIVW